MALKKVRINVKYFVISNLFYIFVEKSTNTIMSDEQVIQAKSAEIKRLRSVCNTKDEAIKKAIGFLDSFSLLISGKELETKRESLINELNQYIG